MINNKNILVIGANGLIGREMIKYFVEKNAKITAMDLKISDELLKFSQDKNINLVECDINCTTSFPSIVENCTEINAAVNLSYPRNQYYGNELETVSLDSFNDNVTKLLGSTYHFMKIFYQRFLISKSHVSLVNFSSIYGVVPPKFSIYRDTGMTMPVEYAAAKSAIIHLTKYFANYANDSRFKVNCVSPGGVFANQNKDFLNRYKENTYGLGLVPISQISNITGFLISDESNYINGQNIVIDDGYTNK